MPIDVVVGVETETGDEIAETDGADPVPGAQHLPETRWIFAKPPAGQVATSMQYRSWRGQIPENFFVQDFARCTNIATR